MFDLCFGWLLFQSFVVKSSQKNNGSQLSLLNPIYRFESPIVLICFDYIRVGSCWF